MKTTNAILNHHYATSLDHRTDGRCVWRDGRRAVATLLVCAAVFMTGCDPVRLASGTNEDFPGNRFAELTEVPGMVLVKFGASWCGPCRELDKELDSLVSSIPVIRVDVDQNGPLASQFQVRAIPHMFLFRDGKVVDQQIGLQTADEIAAWIEKNAS